MRWSTVWILLLFILSPAFSQLSAFADETAVEDRVDWPTFMQRHDLLWKELPVRWEEAPYLGNGNMGSMFYFDKEKDAFRLQLFRTDVQDHRDNSFGWTAYSRPRLQVGSFYLKLKSPVKSCDWKLDLWNATVSGQIQTELATYQVRHVVHTQQMLAWFEITRADGKKVDVSWEFIPGKAKTTRGGYPTDDEQKKEFANRYGSHYLDTLKPYSPNPDPVRSTSEQIELSTQNLVAGGQHAVAWHEESDSNRRTLALSIEASYPETSAGEKAVRNVDLFRKADQAQWLTSHCDWWHDYYRQSFVSIPHGKLESLYWHQMYKLAAATRADRPMMDTSGPWFQPTPWPYITWDLNVQLCYWPTCASNRLDLGRSLINTLHRNHENLIRNVRPESWQSDSAYIPVATAQDLIGLRDGDVRYYKCVGNLTWAMHNAWMNWRYSMDDTLLREKIYPLLRRSVNLYFHLVIEGDDGKLHLPETYSPEYGGATRDCNYDLALFRWGCKALLQASSRLQIDDPMAKRWQDVLDRLVDYPVDQNGYRIGKDTPFAKSHRHYSHLLMVYPLYLVNSEQGDETTDLIEKSIKHWIGNKRSLQGYSYTGASSLSAAIGNGNDALEYLLGLSRFLEPNGLYKESGPVMETPLSAAQSIHDMLLQSWGGTIRVFPATPDQWNNVVFHKMRAEGAFLVSARLHEGNVQWVRVESLAGEPCVVRPGMVGDISISYSTGAVENVKSADAATKFELKLNAGESALIVSSDAEEPFAVEPVVVNESTRKRFGLPGK